MNSQSLIDIARTLVGSGEGLLAIDDSTATCNNRFAKLGIPQFARERRMAHRLLAA